MTAHLLQLYMVFLQILAFWILSAACFLGSVALRKKLYSPLGICSLLYGAVLFLGLSGLEKSVLDLPVAVLSILAFFLVFDYGLLLTGLRFKYRSMIHLLLLTGCTLFYWLAKVPDSMILLFFLPVGVPGFLLSTWMLWKLSSRYPDDPVQFKFASIFTFAIGLFLFLDMMLPKLIPEPLLTPKLLGEFTTVFSLCLFISVLFSGIVVWNIACKYYFEEKKLKKRCLILPTLAFLLFLFLGYRFPLFLYHQEIDDCEKEAAETAENLRDGITTATDYVLRILKSAEKDPWIRSRFSRPGEDRFRSAGTLSLSDLTVMESGLVVYLLNPKGICIDSSNRVSPESFVGGNFSFRSYYRNALNKHYALELGMGSMTKHVAVFACTKVTGENGNLLGFVVVRDSLVPELNRLKNAFVGVISPENIVVATNKLRPHTDKIILEDGRKWLGTGEYGRYPGKCVYSEEPLSGELGKYGWRIAVGRPTDIPLKYFAYGEMFLALLWVITLFLMLSYLIQLKLRFCSQSFSEWRQAVFNNNTSGILVVDSKRDIVDANETALNLLGYRLKELKKVGVEAVHSTRDRCREFAAKAYTSIDATGFYESEVTIVKRSGEERHLRVSGHSLSTQPDKEGKYRRDVVWTLTDETNKVNAIEDLKKSETLYRLLAENSKAHILVLDLEGNLVSSNEPALSARIEQAGTPLKLSDIFSPETAAEYEKLLRGVLNAKRPVRIQHYVSAGTETTFRMDSIYPVHFDGVLTDIGILSYDLTQYKKALSVQAKAEQRFNDVTGMTGTVAWEIASDGTILFRSDNFERLLGETSHDRLTAFAEGDSAAVLERRLRECLDSGVPFSHLECVFHAPGGDRNMLVSGIPLRDSKRNTTGVRGVFCDVTELKTALAIKDHLLSYLTHELRMPLQNAISTAELPGDASSGNGVVRSLKYLSGLIDDASLLFSGHGGSLEGAPEKIVEVCLSAIEILKQTFPGARVNFDRIGNPELLTLHPVKLRQIVLNILSNAVKYSNGSEVRFSLNCDVGSLSISDCGPGIPADIRDSLFEAFKRGSNAENISGFGLGLSIAKMLADVSGMRLSFRTSEAGTVFFVETKTVEPFEIPSGYTPLNLDVLYVEDARSTADIVSRLLESFGCRPVRKETAEEALEYLKDHLCGVVLIDALLPGMDGVQAAVEIRKMGIPVIMMSGADKLDGVEEYLRKPVSKNTLYQALRKIVRT